MHRHVQLFIRRVLYREYWMIIEGQSSRGRMILLLAHPIPSSPVSNLDRLTHRKTKKKRQLADGRGREGGGGQGAEPWDRKKAWSSKNHSILSGPRFFLSVHSYILIPLCCQKQFTFTSLKFHSKYVTFSDLTCFATTFLSTCFTIT